MDADGDDPVVVVAVHVPERKGRQGAEVRGPRLPHEEVGCGTIPASFGTHPQAGREQESHPGEREKSGRPAARAGLGDELPDLLRPRGLRPPHTVGRRLERPREDDREGEAEHRQPQHEANRPLR